MAASETGHLRIADFVTSVYKLKHKSHHDQKLKDKRSLKTND